MYGRMETSTTSRVTPLRAADPELIRTPPYNNDAEQHLLGALLISNSAYARVSEFLHAEHFGHAVHGRIFAATLYFRDRGIVAMTSENFDGEWVARLMSRFGYRAARGSTSRGGARALARLRREMASGHPAAFTVDGPRGPARRAQPGAVWLASATGNPIVPFHIEASQFWTVKSWDSHQIPKPGSEVAVAIGEPIEIAPAADDDAIEAGRQLLERDLAQLERRARQSLKL